MSTVEPKLENLKIDDIVILETSSGWEGTVLLLCRVVKRTATRLTVFINAYKNEKTFTFDGYPYPRQRGYGSNGDRLLYPTTEVLAWYRVNLMRRKIKSHLYKLDETLKKRRDALDKLSEPELIEFTNALEKYLALLDKVDTTEVER